MDTLWILPGLKMVCNWEFSFVTSAHILVFSLHDTYQVLHRSIWGLWKYTRDLSFRKTEASVGAQTWPCEEKEAGPKIISVCGITFMVEVSSFSSGFWSVCFTKNKWWYSSCNAGVVWSIFKGQWLQLKSPWEGSFSMWVSFVRPLPSFLLLDSDSVDPRGPEAVLDQPRNTNQH